MHFDHFARQRLDLALVEPPTRFEGFLLRARIREGLERVHIIQAKIAQCKEVQLAYGYRHCYRALRVVNGYIYISIIWSQVEYASSFCFCYKIQAVPDF